MRDLLARRPTTPPTSSSRSTSGPSSRTSTSTRCARGSAGRCPTGRPTASAVVAELRRRRQRAAVAIPGGRYFGFVIGGAVPGRARGRLADVRVGPERGALRRRRRRCRSPRRSPALARRAARPPARSVVRLRHRLPDGARDRARRRAPPRAARGRLGRRARRASPGAPPIRVVAGEQRHVTVDRALRLLGLGTGSSSSFPADDQGRMRRRRAPRRARAQRRAGDRLRPGRRGEHRLVRRRSTRSPTRPNPRAPGSTSTAPSGSGRPRARGSRTSSPAPSAPTPGRPTAHKWLNVPYDSRDRVLRATRTRIGRAMRPRRLPGPRGRGRPRDQLDWTPEFSRRARGFTVYAAIRSLGRSGIAELVERCCDHARALRRARSPRYRASRC